MVVVVVVVQVGCGEREWERGVRRCIFLVMIVSASL